MLSPHDKTERAKYTKKKNQANIMKRHDREERPRGRPWTEWIEVIWNTLGNVIEEYQTSKGRHSPLDVYDR